MSTTQRAIRPSRVLILAGLGMAASLMSSTILYIALPTHHEELGIALGLVGLIFSTPRVARVLIDGPVGLAFDRWPNRRLLVPVLLLFALPPVVYATARGFWPFVAARLLGGVLWPFVWIGGTAMLMGLSTERDRGRWVGLYQVWYFVGTLLGTLVSGFLVDRFGFRSTMGIAAIVSLMGSLPALFLLPETRPAGAGEERTTPLSRAPLRARFQSVLAAVRAQNLPLPWYANRGLWGTWMLYATNEFVTNGVLATTAALLVRALLPGTNLAIGVATATGLLAAIRYVLSLVTAPLSGALSDRLGKRWPIVLVGLIVSAVSFVMLAAGSPAAAIAGLVAGALGGASVRAVLTALGGDLVGPAERGRALGVLNTSGDLGIMAGPVVAYALLPALGLPGVYLGCAALYALGAGVGLWLTASRLRTR